MLLYLKLYFLTILLDHVFSSFSIIDLYIWIRAVITHIFIAAAKLVIPTVIAIKEAKIEIERNPITIEAKISKCSV